MQLNNQSSSLLTSTKEAKITIKNDYLQTIQKRFAAATIIILLIGTLIALKFAWDFGISLMELELLLVFWFLTMVGGVTVGNHRLLSHCAFKTHPYIRVAFLIPAILGGLLSGTWIGIWQGFLWGGLIRIFVVHHLTWSLNSIVHLYGSRSFNTSEKSTNNVWLAIPTGGEAWHNNHHAFPNSAKFGLQWWQVDLGCWFIRTLEVLGLAWDVKVPTLGMIEAKKTAN